MPIGKEEAAALSSSHHIPNCFVRRRLVTEETGPILAHSLCTLRLRTPPPHIPPSLKVQGPYPYTANTQLPWAAIDRGRPCPYYYTTGLRLKSSHHSSVRSFSIIRYVALVVCVPRNRSRDRLYFLCESNRNKKNTRDSTSFFYGLKKKIFFF